MMQAKSEHPQRIIFIGGGHAHALVLRTLARHPIENAQITVVNPEQTAPYTGMLPGFVAGPNQRGDLAIDIEALCKSADARFVMGMAERIDTEVRRITLRDGQSISYDIASIDVGIHSDMPKVSGFAVHGVPVKPMRPFAAAWKTYLDRVANGAAAARASVIGGGIGGVELSLAMAYALRQTSSNAQVTLLEAGSGIARDTPSGQDRLRKALAALGVDVITGARVAHVTAHGITLEDGEDIASDFTAGAAGARAYDWLAASGLPVTPEGFVRTSTDLRVEGLDTLFAVGDCAHFVAAPRPKAGVFAVRAAPVLTNNIRALLDGDLLNEFSPQRHYLKLVSLGGKSAMASKWGFSVSSPLFWRMKDRIDRAFMDQFKAP